MRIRPDQRILNGRAGQSGSAFGCTIRVTPVSSNLTTGTQQAHRKSFSLVELAASNTDALRMRGGVVGSFEFEVNSRRYEQTLRYRASDQNMAKIGTEDSACRQPDPR